LLSTTEGKRNTLCENKCGKTTRRSSRSGEHRKRNRSAIGGAKLRQLHQRLCEYSGFYCFDFKMTSVPFSEFDLQQAEQYKHYFEEVKKLNPSWIYVDSPGCKVFRIHDSVIKFGWSVDARQAQTMQFIQSSTAIPVPHAIGTGPNAILMDYVEGCTLAQCWPQLTSEEKQAIAEQMYHVLQQLRGLKGSYIGGLDRAPVVDMRRSDHIGGPFDTESQFNDFLLDNMTSSLPSLYRESLQKTLRTDHDIIFTHADLHLRNIIVKDGVIAAILDWECAGWYPEYWEYVKFCDATCHDKEWHDLGPVMFPNRYAFADDLMRDQFYALFVF